MARIRQIVTRERVRAQTKIVVNSIEEKSAAITRAI
jgi:hypothetical protein